MKNISKYIASIALGTALVFSSCETTELDLTENPNFLTPDQASVDFFLNSIQEDFVRELEGDADFDSNDNWESGGATNGDGLSLFGRELTRLSTMTSKQYNSAYQASDSDDEWTNMYLGVLADISAMTPLAEAAGQTRHIGIAQFIEAYLITAMVDFYGDIPYSESILGTDNLNPKLDSGASIYDAALVLLDEAIVNFQSSPSANPANDAFYGNDYDLWENAANTLKMRLYLQRRLVDPSAEASIQAILDSGNYITDSADDFEYVWTGTSASAPDSRHPRYGTNYLSTGAVEYQANWLMNLMDTTNDPRIRYYFFRQNAQTPGAEVDPNEETLQCSLQTPPQHYIDANIPFCFLPNGYWGRNHGDDDGIPPDGLLRTTTGVYPAGGRFDDDSFEGATPGEGAAGVGITPILTAAWVDFMQAELAMVNGNTTDAKTFMVAGMTKQIAKVQSFGARDTSADLSFEPSASDVSDYIAQVEAAFDAATTSGKWDVLAEQLFITANANGVESYNFYRRTGYPTTLEPNLDPNPGVFIRSLFYPSNAVNTNSNITQKADQGQPVFWDTNPSAPAAN
jgi:hypothetical protein